MGGEDYNRDRKMEDREQNIEEKQEDMSEKDAAETTQESLISNTEEKPSEGAEEKSEVQEKPDISVENKEIKPEEKPEEQTEKEEEKQEEIKEEPEEKSEEKKPEIIVEKKERKPFKLNFKKPNIPNFRDVYDKQYRKLLIIPFSILLIAIIIISFQVITTGDFVRKDVSLKGGITITIPTDKDVDINDIESYLSDKFPGSDLSVRNLKQAGRQVGIIVDGTDVESEELIKALELKVGKLEQGDYSAEMMGSSLGQSFFRETLFAILLAFLFMAIVVFIYFRNIIPSVAVVLAALSDMVITLAVVNVIGMRLSTAGIAAFLMLIGYSVDTNILLSTKVLKIKEGSVIDRITGAMKTGLMMSITTLSALTVALIFTQSDVIRQIMIILIIGLLVDIINTWIQNAGILRLYLDRKHRD